MKKTILNSWVAIAIGIASMVTISGCCDDDLANDTTIIPTNVIVDPNVDQLQTKVTANVPTAVLSSFDDKSMGAALVRRLPNTTNSIQGDTKMVLIKGEDILSRPLTEWIEAARIYLKGGYIAVEKPHNAHLVEVAEQLSNKLEQATHDVLKESGHITITPPEQVSSNSINIDAERMGARIVNIATIAGSRANASSEAVAEMVVFSPMGFYQCDPYQDEVVHSSHSDNDGEEVEEDEIFNSDYTKLNSGLLADGVAEWLNYQGNRTAVSKSRLLSKADGQGSINEMMSASEEHYYNRSLFDYDWNKNTRKKPYGFSEVIRVWGSHNMKTNKDYYFVQQSALSAVGGEQEGDARFDPNKTLYAGPYKEKEWIKTDYSRNGKHYKAYYGSWWQYGEYSLNLVGSGTIRLEDALPTTDNNNTSTSIAVGETHSETNTIGGSLGFSGWNLTGSANYSHGWTDGTSYTMTSTTNAKEITVEKNTDKNKVKWNYENSQNIYGSYDYDDKHKLASASVTTDVNVDNQACWSVENPEGAYTLEVTSSSYMKCMWTDKDDHKCSSTNGPSSENNKYELIIPNRAEQTWYMDITFPEIGQPGHEGHKGLLTQRMGEQFPSIYQTEVKIADRTEESENTIKILVNQADNVLHNTDGGQTMREYALDLGISQYTITWYTIDGKHSKYGVTVKAREE
ncbi:MAG: hypothetical protein IKQ32_04350 [Prevotella sp.]|nr:hypothetical protein [Prevotella sp.]